MKHSMKIVVFGAGGRAGRRVVAEALARGHEVTSVVRSPERALAVGGTVVAGDVTDASSVAAVAAGHDAAVNAAGRIDVPAEAFFGAAAQALVAGLTSAGVRRLVAIGIGTNLETEPGVLVHDAPEFPADWRAFSLGHIAELEVLRGSGDALDWLVLAPPPVLLDDAASRTGRYRLGGVAVLPGVDSFSYADLAVAVVDEIDAPTRHRELAAAGPEL